MRIILLVLIWASFLFPQGEPVRKNTDEKRLVRALKTAQTPGDRRSALQNLYNYYQKHNIDTLAHSYLKKLIHAQKAVNDLRGLETSYTRLAHIEENKKNYPTALDHYFEALNYSGKIENDKSGMIYLDIANLFTVMNRRQLAAKYLKKALDYTINHKTSRLKIRVLNAYSSLAFYEQDYTNALKYINLSLKTEKELNKYVCGTESLYMKALTLSQTGSKENEIIPLLKRAVDGGLKMKDYKNLLPIIKAYVQRLIDNRELVEAGLYLDKIDDIYAPYHPQFFFYYYLRAVFFEKMDRMDEALSYYRQTAGALGQYFVRPGEQARDVFKAQTVEIYSRIVGFYIDMFNRTRMKKYLHNAIYYSEVKNSYIYEFDTAAENEQFLHLEKEKKKLEEEYIAYHKRYTRMLTGQEEQDPERLERYERKLDALKKQNDELIEVLFESPISVRPYTFDNLNIPGIREKLKPGQLIVKYAVLEKKTFAFSLDRERVEYRELEISSPALTALIRRLTEPLDDFTNGNVDYLRINYDLQAARRLYDILLKDILNRRTDVEEIFIIPDGELFKIPFEALVPRFNRGGLDPGIVFSEYASADYLVQDYAVSYLFSLFHFRGEPPPVPGKRYAVSAFGSPLIRKTKKDRTNGYIPPDTAGTMPGSTVNGDFFKELPASGQEIQDIADIFGKRESRIFSGARFNRKNFETFAPRSRVVHIATHFISNSHYPRYSALLFSPIKKNDAVDYYYAHEIFKLKLDTELVVLSACESSEKNLLGMQGLRGMTASFRNAGVHSMMVGLWPVDEHSCRLVSLFYRRSRDGEKDAVALRDAKLALMKETGQLGKELKISFSHPFIWANYILYRFW